MDWSRFDPKTFGGVDEATLEVCALPKSGFIRSWYDHMKPLTDANAGFHLVNALALLSAVVPPSVTLPDGDDLHANFYAFVVGASSKAHKTHTVEQAGKLLRALAPSGDAPGVDYWMDDPVSEEALIETMIRTPKRLLMSAEGSVFLRKTAKDQAGANVRSRIMALHECTPVSHANVDKVRKKQVIIQRDPRLSVLIACTPGDLEAFTEGWDWRSGFMSRFFLYEGAKSRDLDAASADIPGRERVLALYRNYAGVPAVGQCIGYEPDAVELFRSWRAHVPGARPETSTPNLCLSDRNASVIDRAQLHARKIALLLAYDRHVEAFARNASPSAADAAYLERAWAVTADDMRVAVSLATFHVCAALHLTQNLSEGEDGRRMRQIVNFVNGKGGVARYSEILNELDSNKRYVDSLLDTLVAMRRVHRTENSVYGEPVYSALTQDASGQFVVMNPELAMQTITGRLPN